MKQSPMATNTAPVAGKVLSVSPIGEDHAALERICKHALCADGKKPWQLTRTHSLESALTALRLGEFFVVMCERDLGRCSWRDLLERLRGLAHPPFLVVTSRHADDYLWAEALNLGAYDVLAKPFYATEVVRVLNLACLRWLRECQHPDQPQSLAAMAS